MIRWEKVNDFVCKLDNGIRPNQRANFLTPVRSPYQYHSSYPWGF
jgi:hypothetical protein